MSINYLKNFDQADFESWLRVGLERTLLEGAGAWAFPGADHKIRRSEYLALGLRDAYLELDAEKRGHFRRAVANVLASLEPTRRNVLLFEELLSIAAALPAPDILRVLPARVGNGFFGQVKNGAGDSLFGITMLTVARLAAPRAEAVDCLMKLIRDSRHFDSAYAGMALEALCRSDDESFVSHMSLLRDALAAMFREYQVSDDAKTTLAMAILDRIGLRRVIQSWPDLKYFDMDFENAPLDDWFVLGLLHGRAAGLICEQDPGGHIYVFRGDNPVLREVLPETGSGFTRLLDLLQEYDLVTNKGIWFEKNRGMSGEDRGRCDPEVETPGEGSTAVAKAFSSEPLTETEEDLAKSFGLTSEDLRICQPMT